MYNNFEFTYGKGGYLFVCLFYFLKFLFWLFDNQHLNLFNNNFEGVSKGIRYFKKYKYRTRIFLLLCVFVVFTFLNFCFEFLAMNMSICLGQSQAIIWHFLLYVLHNTRHGQQKGWMLADIQHNCVMWT